MNGAVFLILVVGNAMVCSQVRGTIPRVLLLVLTYSIFTTLPQKEKAFTLLGTAVCSSKTACIASVAGVNFSIYSAELSGQI